MPASISAFDRLASSGGGASRQNGRTLQWLVTIFVGCIAFRFSYLFIDLRRVQSLVFGNDADDLTSEVILSNLMQGSEPYKRPIQEIEPVIQEDQVERQAEETTSLTENGGETKEVGSSCLEHNSKEWLEGPRIGNIREGMTPEVVKTMILDNTQLLQSSSSNQARDILDQSMCQGDSRFVNPTRDPSVDENDPKLIRLWGARLAFFGMHYHQHRFAVPEAQARYSESSTCSQEDLTTRYDVGNFDYECKGAKFALFGLAGIGIGANIRGGAAVALMAGLSSDRVVLFAGRKDDGSRSTWDLASCDRADHQCFFMPMSPCVISQQDLDNAWVMPKPDSRQYVVKTGKIPKEHENDKVVQSMLMFQPSLKVPKRAKEKLASYAHMFIDNLSPDDRRIKLLRKAADSLLEDDPPREGYGFAAASQKSIHALEFYAMRPSPSSARELANILEHIIPSDIDVEATIGLPIRASDKCHKESECLTFDQHMQVTSDIWSKHLNATGQTGKDLKPAIIFTTESNSVAEQQIDFAGSEERQSKYPHRFQFITNTKDVTPGTGLLKKKAADRKGITADEAMLSSMSSLQAQMKARVSIGNCCSNFHTLLSDYMMEGCGSASESTYVCLQEHDDPINRVCCGWHNDCKEQKRKAIAALELKKKAASSPAD